MSRWIAALVLLAASLCAQDAAQDKPQELKKRGDTTKPQEVDKDGLPPEEDKSLAVREYGFNPVQAQKEIRTGNYYFKKGSYRAAAGRFEEATKWNSGEKKIELQSRLLAPVPITRDNLDVVVKAGWIKKDELCKGVSGDKAPAACK